MAFFDNSKKKKKVDEVMASMHAPEIPANLPDWFVKGAVDMPSLSIFTNSEVNVFRYGLFNCEMLYNEFIPQEPVLFINNSLIIEEYRKISGIPLVLNTSFNAHGEPINNYPSQVIKHLFNGCVDYLITEDYIISNNSDKI